ncbi:MAG: hypothetical protein HUU50_03425 [Candidatus Brocadiae bacterium]|nr:hypothetical protein [Candidatus Brocadiia bacterium]
MKKLLPTLAQVGFLCIYSLSVFTGSHLLEKINQKREEYKLTQNQPLENAPPELVLATTALGGLRGFIIDYLWLRATELRNKGSNYEIIQLYDWIGKLEPRIADVWSFTSWEMAYNISVTMPSHQDRWRWIYKGIEQLRDLGLRYNQNMPKLYWELGYLIFDKIEMNSLDEYHLYYQQEWFDLWDTALSGYSLQELSKASNDWNSLIKEPEIASLLKELEDANINITKEFYQSTDENLKKMQSILHAPKNQASAKKLLACIISTRIRKEFKMEPQKMYDLEQKYGELDWRLPATHSLYWVKEGLKVVEAFPKFQSSSIHRNLHRLQYLSLKRSFEYGKYLTSTSQRIVCIPNFSLLDTLHETFVEIGEKWGSELGLESHQDFLEHAIKKCYLYNQKGRAEKYFEILRKKFRHPDYKLDLDNFVIRDIARTIQYGTQHVVENYIVAKQLEAYQSLLSGIPDQYEGITRFVMILYNRYKERHGTEEHNVFEQARSIGYFQNAAVKLLQKNLEAKVGKEAVKKVWQTIIKQFPLFSQFPPP